MTRREALALLGVLAAAGCGPHAVAAPEVPHGPSLALDPLVDLAPAAGLVWLIDARAQELLASPVLAPGVALVLPPARFDAFADRKAAHMLSALRQCDRIVLGHMMVEEKSNEIPSAPELIEALGLKDCVFTLDAAHCQKNCSSA